MLRDILESDALVLVTPVYWGEDSGNGAVSCLASMELLIRHVGARRFDMISVNRWNREYKLRTIGESAAAMAGSTSEARSS